MMWDDHFEAPLKARKPDNWTEIVGNYRGPYRFPEKMMLYAEKPKRRETEKNRKRSRATALVAVDGKLLLVRERGSKQWSLPGGGMERGEGPISAACREIEEETGLTVLAASFLFDYESHYQHHRVCSLSVKGNVRLQRKELSDFKWWDGRIELPKISSAEHIIGQAKSMGHLDVPETNAAR